MNQRLLPPGRRRRAAAVLVVALLAMAFAPVPRPKPARPDFVREELARLRGDWEWVRAWADGERWPKGDGALHAFRGDRLTTSAGGVVTGRWKVVLRPGGEPGAADLEGDGGQLLCAYELAGDELTLAWVLPGGKGDRPPDVKPRQGAWVVVYKRVKKKS